MDKLDKIIGTFLSNKFDEWKPYLTKEEQAVFILYYFAEDMSSDITEIAGNLTNISEQVEIDYDTKLVVTSNDEIGDLVVAFNKILDLEKNITSYMI